jgi:hypothetical protein
MAGGFSLKAGANRTDQNRIYNMATQGYSAHEISDALRIDVECVVNFMPEVDAVEEPETDPDEE